MNCYIDNSETPPHVKKQAEILLYGVPERMVTTIFAENHCIADTFHLPTIREFEYQLSDDFQKLYTPVSSGFMVYRSLRLQVLR